MYPLSSKRRHPLHHTRLVGRINLLGQHLEQVFVHRGGLQFLYDFLIGTVPGPNKPHHEVTLLAPRNLLTCVWDRSSIELKDNTVIVVLGASGDLAKKKTVCLMPNLECLRT